MTKQLIFSESFVNFLHEIATESKVARLIISCRNARSDGFTFLYKLVLKLDEVNYITYRNNGLLSYMPAGREQEYNDDNTWKRDGRQEGRPAKIMRKIFTDNALKCLKDSDFEIFNNKYKSKYSTGNMHFTVEPNEKIPHVYCMKRKDGGSSLNGSCMNDDGDYLDMYRKCENLEIIALITEDGLLAGRCLLWSLDYEGETIKFADRIYVSDDHLYDAFLSYIEENKWWRKKYYKTYDYRMLFIKPNGDEISHKFIVNLNTDHEEYPYIDTFHFGGDGYITNKDSNIIYTYCDTAGGREGGLVWDEIDEIEIHPDNAVCIDRGVRRHQMTHIDNAVSVCGEYYYIHSDEIVCIGDEYYHIDDCVYSEYDSEYYLAKDCVHSTHHNSYILKSDAYEVEGEYYHEDVVTKL